MSISPVPTPAPAQPQQTESTEGQQAEQGVENGVEGLQNAVEGLSLGEGLHRACAEGKVEEVRAILSRSLEGLETLGE